MLVLINQKLAFDLLQMLLQQYYRDLRRVDIVNKNILDRKQQLEAWLNITLGEQAFTLSVASADASFRRYFRVHLGD